MNEYSDAYELLEAHWFEIRDIPDGHLRAFCLS